MVQIGARSAPVESVAQWVIEVSPSGKPAALVQLLQDKALQTVLVFSRTKHGADRLAKRTSQAGISTATLHSNRTQGQRLQALNRFRSGDVRVLIATDIAARGIDVDGISHVINYDFPPQPEDYVHRIGRTGRAQAIGDAISFITRDDHDNLKRLERFLGRGITRKKLEGLPVVLPELKPEGSSERPKREFRPRGHAHGPQRFGRRGPKGRRGRT
jgi:ATP-dependent RNA helicase RhlE